MKILGIETSCDETSAAVLEQANDRIIILSNVVASSASLQAKYGGIIPEQAAREQIKAIIPVIQEALIQSNLYPPSSKIHLQSSNIYRPTIDAIAVTQGPGLIGSLLVGVETAKTLSWVWDKPLIPVNHLLGHFYANWIFARGDGKRGAPPSVEGPGARNEVRTSDGAVSRQDPEQTVPIFPCLGLLVSGGHTDLVLFKDHGKYQYLGGTRDDAAGECFDKCARLLGLPYPGGPQISKLAQIGNPNKFKLPVPMKDSQDLDFSFSGLKTAVANIALSNKPQAVNYAQKADLAASIEETIIKHLINKVVKAAQIHEVEQIMVAGGVAANQRLKETLELEIRNLDLEIDLHIPPPELCTDNGAMIAAAAFFIKPIQDMLRLQANPNLSLEMQQVKSDK